MGKYQGYIAKYEKEERPACALDFLDSHIRNDVIRQ
jgi:hypothetical protein